MKNTVLVTGAMTDRDPEAHRRSIQKIFPRIETPHPIIH